MGGAAGPELQQGIGEREMTHTLEGKAAIRRALERGVRGDSASRETSVSVTGAGHRGEAGAP